MPAHPLFLRRRSALLVPFAIAAAGCAQASSAEPAPPYRLDAFRLDSADGQRRYRVQLAVPAGAAPAAGRPVIYLLDGTAAFAEIAPAEWQRLAALPAGDAPVVVAVGHDTATPVPAAGDDAAPAAPARAAGVDVLARAYDYTPQVAAGGPTTDEAGRPSGGADAFLDLLAQRIRPEVARRVPALDPARQTLWGHSYGGLLAVYAFLTRPALFNRYAAADPSLWWHGGYMLQVEQRAAPLPAGRVTELLVMAGSAAADVAGGAQRPLRPGVDAATAGQARAARSVLPPDAVPAFTARQAQRIGTLATFRAFPGVGHGPLRAASLPLALEFAAHRG